MTTKRRGNGEGAIDERGPDTWRLRYRVGGKRFAVTVHRSKAAAQRELRRLLREGDVGEHVEPSKITVAAWAQEWLALIRRGQVTVRSVGADAGVDLSLIQLPAGALMFPSPPQEGDFDFTRLRNPHSVTKETRRRFRKLGFTTLRFHDLRGSHGTALLDAGVPVHVVAERLGHDPAMLLRAYAKRNRKSDRAAAAVIGELAKGVL